MSILVAESVPVADLRPGDMVRYGGDGYRVAEVLPVAVLSGHVVVGWSYVGGVRTERVALVYAMTVLWLSGSAVRNDRPPCSAASHRR